jgi:hypothetical protein
MVQTKTTMPKTLAVESEQAIKFLTVISDTVKHQRRHFDDAVVTHCIRLIHDYVDERSSDSPVGDGPGSAGHERRS